MKLRSFVVLIVTMVACSKATPAGFWGNFRKDFIVTSESDQGPFGGYREMYWKTNSRLKFSREEAISFATKNGWTLVESSINLVNENDSTYQFSPTWIKDESVIYSFKTGFLLFHPDTNEAIPVNGFIVLKNDNLEMEVFHKWGE